MNNAARPRPTLSKDALFAIVVGVCMINGIFSPYVAVARQIALILMPEAFPRSVGWVQFFSSIIVATGTLLLSGIPAALYERFSGPAGGTGGDRGGGGPVDHGTTPLWLWLTAATLLSLPALDNIDRVM
jgi:hypothetical protein